MQSLHSKGNVPSEIRLKVARRGPVQSLHSKRLCIWLLTRDDRSQWKMKSCHKKRKIMDGIGNDIDISVDGEVEIVEAGKRNNEIIQR